MVHADWNHGHVSNRLRSSGVHPPFRRAGCSAKSRHVSGGLAITSSFRPPANLAPDHAGRMGVAKNSSAVPRSRRSLRGRKMLMGYFPFSPVIDKDERGQGLFLDRVRRAFEAVTEKKSRNRGVAKHIDLQILRPHREAVDAG